MRKFALRFVALSALLAVAATFAFAMIISFDVEVRNNFDVPKRLELVQYHSKDFNGTRPQAFSDELKLIETTVELPPHSSKVIQFNSAAGGFWLRWRVLELQSTPTSEGVLDLKPGKQVLELK